MSTVRPDLNSPSTPLIDGDWTEVDSGAEQHLFNTGGAIEVYIGDHAYNTTIAGRYEIEGYVVPENFIIRIPAISVTPCTLDTREIDFQHLRFEFFFADVNEYVQIYIKPLSSDAEIEIKYNNSTITEQTVTIASLGSISTDIALVRNGSEVTLYYKLAGVWTVAFTDTSGGFSETTLSAADLGGRVHGRLDGAFTGDFGPCMIGEYAEVVIPDVPSFTVGEEVSALTRQSIWLLILYLDYCQEENGESPCTATAPCYFTWSTCLDTDNYNKGEREYRFSNRGAPYVSEQANIFEALPLLVTSGSFPSISTKINQDKFKTERGETTFRI
jgi:hypothetical protein